MRSGKNLQNFEAAILDPHAVSERATRIHGDAGGGLPNEPAWQCSLQDLAAYLSANGEVGSEKDKQHYGNNAIHCKEGGVEP